MKKVRTFAVILLIVIALWTAAAIRGGAQAQGGFGNGVRIVGIGTQSSPLPTRSDGSQGLPVKGEDRQLTFTAEQWQNGGTDVVSLLYSNTILPRQVTICGHKLTMIQGSLMNNATDESYYFPLTIVGTRLAVPDDGCYSMTPVAYLRIRAIMKVPREQLTNAIVTAVY